MNSFELVVVMPVYNEDACICKVVDAWHEELTSLGIDFQIILLNDGSKDETAQKLSAYSGNTRVEVINKPNSGHGPTILQGYHLAVHRADWVFQADSDDEMSPLHFVNLWRQREGRAALFGYRTGRMQNSGRKIISAVSRLAVRSLFGSGIIDVNTPYRLIQAHVLSRIIDRIPDDTFAPNIIVSGVLAASKLPILNVPVPHEGRKSGSVSIVRMRLLKAAIRSMFQTLVFSARRIRV